MNRVLTVGVFDLLHYGHIELFRRAKELARGGSLTVAIQLDDYVKKYKPSTELVYNWDVRRMMVSAIRYVDYVVSYGDIDKSIKNIEFDTFVLGGDQVHAGFVRAEQWCREHAREVVRLQRTPGICSSELRRCK